MGRGQPTYDLEYLQQLVGQGPLSCSITQTASDEARMLGMLEDDIVAAVLELGPGDFYKTMEAEKSPGLWQDVYHLEFRGQHLYIKLQISASGRAVVVQCKRR